MYHVLNTHLCLDQLFLSVYFLDTPLPAFYVQGKLHIDNKCFITENCFESISLTESRQLSVCGVTFQESCFSSCPPPSPTQLKIYSN
jgi:hypothetical protein